MVAAFDGRIVGLLVLGLGIGVLTGVAVRSTGGPLFPYLRGFAALFALAVLAHVLAQQSAVRAAGFPYAFWALALGMLISNSIATPRWLQAARAESCSSRPASCFWERRFCSGEF